MDKRIFIDDIEQSWNAWMGGDPVAQLATDTLRDGDHDTDRVQTSDFEHLSELIADARRLVREGQPTMQDVLGAFEALSKAMRNP